MFLRRKRSPGSSSGRLCGYEAVQIDRVGSGQAVRVDPQHREFASGLREPVTDLEQCAHPGHVEKRQLGQIELDVADIRRFEQQNAPARAAMALAAGCDACVGEGSDA